MNNQVVVIGAGIGGLTAAAILTRAGLPVLVLEAQVYPGGCASTFYHQGYRFDAGATLAGGFYPGGPMDLVAKQAGIPGWAGKPADPAMLVHLPGGLQVSRFGDERRFAEHLEAFGEKAQEFWRWQEERADAMWRLALKAPDWPPQSPRQAVSLFKKAISWILEDKQGPIHPGILLDAFRPLSSHLEGLPDSLRLFIDAQLLISAQATSEKVNALYGASALDLPRRGVMHLQGGIGTIAEELVKSIRQNGGQVIYRQEVARIIRENWRIVAVETQRGERFDADLVIANLTSWNIQRLLDPSLNPTDKQTPPTDIAGWGAFILYLGVEEHVFSKSLALHHQVIQAEPLGEGRSIFLSISPGWDTQRAPQNHRAVTISTHTQLAPWWHLHNNDPQGYAVAKQTYTDRVMQLASQVFPGIQEASSLVLAGTPVTFERFTRRAWGWVGGFPQVNLFQNRGPKLAPGLWMVGDSIFPGQSTAAVALGGYRVALNVLSNMQ